MFNLTNKYLIFFLIILFGLILRFYNINFDNYWYDEIISFWVVSPEHNLYESHNIHNRIEINTYSYNFLLKLFYQIFGYDSDFGRYLSLFFSILSLLVVPLFFDGKNSTKEGFLFLFLLSFNIYLISYSQEARVYSALFFFSSLFVFFFKKFIENKNNFLDYFLLIFCALVAIFLHPFAIIILIACLFFLFLKYYFTKIIYDKLNYSLILITVITTIFYFLFINSLEHPNPEHYWIKHPDLKFYTNFFFSNFFGSRIMGLSFLFILIFLIIKESHFIKKLNFLSFLLILTIFSYFLPILFGYLFKPVLLSRYIIFVILPILLLISNLIFKIKNLNIRNFLVAFLVLITIANHFTEQSFKQFFKTRIPSKTEYFKAIDYIKNSGNLKYFIKVDNMKSNIDTSNAIKNYIDHIGAKNDTQLKFLNLSKERLDNKVFWMFCAQDINPRECLPPESLIKFEIIEEKNFNNINLKLLQTE